MVPDKFLTVQKVVRLGLPVTRNHAIRTKTCTVIFCAIQEMAPCKLYARVYFLNG